MTITALKYVGPISPSSADYNNAILKINEVALANGLNISPLLRAPLAGDDFGINSVVTALNVVLAKLKLQLHPLITDPLSPSGGQLNGIIARVNDAVFATNNPSDIYTLPDIELFHQISQNVPTGGLTWIGQNVNLDGPAGLTESLWQGAPGTFAAAIDTSSAAFEIFTGDQYGLHGSRGIDLTGYNTVSIDVDITQADGDAFLIGCNNINDWGNQSNVKQANTTIGATGTFTLNVDISSWVNKTTVTFDLLNFESTVGTFTGTIHNLRASA